MTQGLQLVTEIGVKLCQTITIPSYGIVKCKTNAIAIDTAKIISVLFKGNVYSCAGTTDECSYATSSSMPIVSGATISSAKVLSLTGSGFQLTTFPGVVVFAGIHSDSVDIVSDTSINATFNNGVPIA